MREPLCDINSAVKGHVHGGGSDPEFQRRYAISSLVWPEYDTEGGQSRPV